MPDESPPIITVALNPAVDRTLEVPGLELGGHVRGRLVSTQPAGKAVNVARLLGTLGTPCVLTGFVGRDERGRFVRSLEKLPVRVEMFEADKATRENITLIDPEKGVETHVRDEGFRLTEDELEKITRKLYILSGEGAYVLFTGSLPPDMGAGAFARMLHVCRSREARPAVDSSGPGLEPVRAGEAMWLVKPNLTELAQLTGRTVSSEAEVPEAAAALRDHVELVVVTLGPAGAYVFGAGGAWRAAAKCDPRAVVNTVGCGDALLAGFVRAHAAGHDLDDCLRWGVAVGTAASMQVRAGEVDPEQAEALYRDTDVAAV